MNPTPTHLRPISVSGFCIAAICLWIMSIASPIALGYDSIPNAALQENGQDFNDRYITLPEIDRPKWLFDEDSDSFFMYSARSTTIYQYMVRMDGSVTTEETALPDAPIDICVKGNRLFLITVSSSLIALDISTGEILFQSKLDSFQPRQISCTSSDDPIVYLTGLYERTGSTNPPSGLFIEFDVNQRSIKRQLSLNRFGIDASSGKIANDGVTFNQKHNRQTAYWNFDPASLRFDPLWISTDASTSSFELHTQHPTINLTTIVTRPNSISNAQARLKVIGPGQPDNQLSDSLKSLGRGIQMMEWANAGTQLVITGNQHLIVIDPGRFNLETKERLAIYPIKIPILTPGEEIRVPLVTNQIKKEALKYSLRTRGHSCRIEGQELVIRASTKDVGQNLNSVHVTDGEQSAFQHFRFQVRWPAIDFGSNPSRFAVSTDGEYVGGQGTTIQIHGVHQAELKQRYAPGSNRRNASPKNSFVFCGDYLFAIYKEKLLRLSCDTDSNDTVETKGKVKAIKRTVDGKLYVRSELPNDKYLCTLLEPSSLQQTEWAGRDNSRYWLDDENSNVVHQNNMLFDYSTGNLHAVHKNENLPEMFRPHEPLITPIAYYYSRGRHISLSDRTSIYEFRKKTHLVDTFGSRIPIDRPAGIRAGGAVRLKKVDALCEVGMDFENNQVSLFLYRLYDGKLAQTIPIASALPFHKERLKNSTGRIGNFDLSFEKERRHPLVEQTESRIFVLYHGTVFQVPQTVVDDRLYPVPDYVVPPTNPVVPVGSKWTGNLDLYGTQRNDPRLTRVYLDNQYPGVILSTRWTKRGHSNETKLEIDTRELLVHWMRSSDQILPNFQRTRKEFELTGEQLPEGNSVLHLSLRVTMVRPSGKAARQSFGLFIVAAEEQLKMVSDRNAYRYQLKHADALELSVEQRTQAKKRIAELDIQIAEETESLAANR